MGVVVDGEFGGLVIGQDLADAGLVFVPIVVLQGGDVEESVVSLGVELGSVGGVERAPAIQIFCR